MSEYTFKRALIRNEETWKVDGTRLIGPDVSIELSEVSACDFSYTPLKRNLTASELRLTVNETSTLLDCTANVGTQHRHSFLSLVHDIVQTLKTQKPELEVTSKGTDIMAWGFATIGGVSALWGIYFAVSHLSDNDPRFAIGVGAVMVLMGAFMIWVGSPWTTNKPKSLTETTEWIERLKAL